MLLHQSSPNFATCSVVTQIFKIWSEICLAPPPKFSGPKTSKFLWFRDLVINIVNWKTMLQTTDTPMQANLIQFASVHKRQKIGPEFWPMQWAAIRLGIATHRVTAMMAVESGVTLMIRRIVGLLSGLSNWVCLCLMICSLSRFMTASSYCSSDYPIFRSA